DTHSAIKLNLHPCHVGDSFGWWMCWLKVVLKIPEAWRGKEVHLRWESDGEFGSVFVFLSQFSALPYMWNLHVMDPDPNRKFTLQKAELVVFTRAVRELLTDFEIIPFTVAVNQWKMLNKRTKYCVNSHVIFFFFFFLSTFRHHDTIQFLYFLYFVISVDAGECSDSWAQISRFLTQKVSWNLVNTFPIKGKVEDLINTMKNTKDKGRANHSAFSSLVLDCLQGVRDTDCLSKVQMSSLDVLFSLLESDSSLLCTWVGELLLELHNGTYTTQAKIKLQNLQCEALLHDVELASCLALCKTDNFKYPACKLQELLLLLNQFYDVIPGSCIEMVDEDALQYYDGKPSACTTWVPIVIQVYGTYRKKLCYNSRETISEGCHGNQFTLFDDVPLYWDARDVMDYHLQTRNPVIGFIEPAMVLRSGIHQGSVSSSLRISRKCTIRQEIVLDACHPQSLQFSSSVGTQTGFGVALLNDSKYGYSIHENIMTLSLLRAPKAPGANAAMGHHKFTYALMPHTGHFQDALVIQYTYNLNFPLHVFHGVISEPWSVFSVNSTAVTLETVKHNALLVRLYESHGSSVTMTLPTSLPVHKIRSLLLIIQ
uniref:Mannosidase, alpha, class 2C, member 1 n=1 Tax=Cyprinus carpio TaxID=7962 RepID=A0A8C1KE57_CYPCA